MLALTHFLIVKYKDAFSQISIASFQRKKRFELLFSSICGYNNLKKAMKEAPTPMIPAMIIISRELTKIEGEDTIITKGSTFEMQYLNFKKLEDTHNVLEFVFKIHNHTYKFERINYVFDFFSDTYKCALMNLDKGLDLQKIEEKLFIMSQN